MTPQTLTPEMLETRSGSFDNRIRRRNRWEYIASAIVAVFTIGIGAWMLLTVEPDPPSLMVGIGFLILGLGAISAAIQLRRRAGGPTAIDGSQSARTAYRAELVRQRDALRSIFWWYIAPFLPGFLLIYGASVFEPDGIEWATLFPGLLTAIFVIWMTRANRKAADCLDEEIKAVDREG